MKKILEFIDGEVTRQGFEPGTESHKLRRQWMREAWTAAQALAEQKPTVKRVIALGGLVEQVLNLNGFRRCSVYIGAWRAPDHSQIARLMAAWEEALARLTPDEAYVEFEKIHPFADGNGRTGKIIHNWLGGTLNDPVLVKDYFGHGVP